MKTKLLWQSDIVCVVFCAALSSSEAQAQKVYFTSGGAVWQMNPDGSQLNKILGSATEGFGDVAVAQEDSTLYMTAGFSGGTGIARSGLNGENLEFVVTGLRSPGTIAVDALHKKIYYTSHHPECSCTWQSNLDGSDARKILDVAFEEVVVDPEAGYLFHRALGAIYRSDLNGGSLTAFYSGGVGVNDIALDPIGHQLYWTDGSENPPGGGVPNPPFGRIFRGSYDTGGGRVILENSAKLFRPLYASEIAVDPIHGIVYWYNPVVHNINAATTSGEIVREEVLPAIFRPGGGGILNVDGMAVSYAIPEPGTLPLAMGVIAACGWLVRGGRRRAFRVK